MPVQQRFTPGKGGDSSRVIRYVALYNALNPSQPSGCVCIPSKYDKRTLGSDSPSVRVSNNMRVAQIVNSSLGGKTQFGNFYLGQPLRVNYLGRVEGQPGGSGKPPTNSFR